MRSRDCLAFSLGLLLLLPLSSAHASGKRDDGAATAGDDDQAKPADADADELPRPKKKKTHKPADTTDEATPADDADAMPRKANKHKPVTDDDTPTSLTADAAPTNELPPRVTYTAVLLGATALDKGNRDLFSLGGGFGAGLEIYVSPLLGIHANGTFVMLTQGPGMSSTTWIGGGVGPRLHFGTSLFGDATYNDAWIEAHANYGASGGIRRPGFDLAAAVEWEISAGLRLGPMLRYQFGSDPRDSNAQLATIGVALDYGGRTRLPIHYEFTDTDDDGIADSDDKCPEEKAGKHPDPARRGCPRPPDGDGDDIPDADDVCPEEMAGETPDPERPGCPAPPGQSKLAEVKGNKIEIFQQVYFETNSATIEDRSHHVLAVVGKIISHLKGKRVRIEGHTDETGSDAYNLDLSKRRARAVAQWLVEYAEVDPAALETEGYGKSRPLTKGANTELNRRVEFVILDK
jgi:outer membrane protein OmpA-like peptidoglycan-associated protein